MCAPQGSEGSSITIYRRSYTLCICGQLWLLVAKWQPNNELSAS